MKLRIGVLRKLIRESIKNYAGSGSEELYRLGTEETLMLDQPGMEKKYRHKIRDYLRKIGMIK